MRHRVAGRKLNRTSGHRRALRRNLVQSLFEHGQIQTTLPKAKEIRPMAERLITLARNGSLHSRRRAFAIMRDREIFEEKEGGQGDYEYSGRVLAKLFDEIGPRFIDRPGGYTRIVRTSKRRIGDAAFKVVLMLVGEEAGGSGKPAGTTSRRRRRAQAKQAAAGAGDARENVAPETAGPQDGADQDAKSADEAPAEEDKQES